MSTEKLIHEAKRWFKTAEDDFDSAKILKENGKFAHSCFHFQQAAEKAVKSVWYFLDADPWGHSVKMLIDGLEQINLEYYEQMKDSERVGRILDRFYIPTRYPNGLPDITPNEAFSQEDAQVCLEYAEEIIDRVRVLLKL